MQAATRAIANVGANGGECRAFVIKNYQRGVGGGFLDRGHCVAPAIQGADAHGPIEVDPRGKGALLIRGKFAGHEEVV
jgi:hypothetical protein